MEFVKYNQLLKICVSYDQDGGYIPEDLPSWITLHIDWQAVWDCELCYDYFKFDGHYFRNL